MKTYDTILPRLLILTGYCVGLAAAWMLFVNHNSQAALLVSLSNQFIKAAQTSVKIQEGNLDKPVKVEDQQ